MAKVMVSLPDELLSEVDAEAARAGTTRSAVLRGFAVQALGARRSVRAAEAARLLSAATGHGGHVARHIEDDRAR